jgi:hypothetical protein
MYLIMKRIIVLPALLAVSLMLAGCTTGTPLPDQGTSSSFSQEAPVSTDPEKWAEFKQYGATLPSEDPAVREITAEEFNAYENAEDTTRVQGEVTADTEATAVKLTEWLKANPDATQDAIPADVVVNRYPNLVVPSYQLREDKEYEVYMNPVDGANIGGLSQTTAFSSTE